MSYNNDQRRGGGGPINFPLVRSKGYDFKIRPRVNTECSEEDLIGISFEAEFTHACSGLRVIRVKSNDYKLP